MDPDDLKKIAAIFKTNISSISAEDQKLLSEFISSRSSNASAPATTKNPELQAKKDDFERALIDKAKKGLTEEDSRLAKLEKGEAMKARLIDAAPRRIIQSTTQPNDPYESRIRNMVNKELGITDAFSERRSEFDLNRLDAKAAAIGKTRDEYETMPRLERMKLESAGAAAEQARRQGIRDSVALPISDNAAWADGFKQQGLPTPGNKRDIFKDKNGRLEDPATLKARLIKEGMNPNDATIAAGQRYRDMFAPPNAKKDGFGMQGGQASAVMNADPERRMDVMQQLKDARKDNLQALAEARRNNPFRKEVGVTTKIETSDGRVLAEREEAVGVARGGTAGAVGSSVDKIGPMKLTLDGERAIANRTSVATTTPEKLGFTSTKISPEEKQKFEEDWKKSNPNLPVPGANRPTNEVQVVSGRFGTAVGGLSVTDQLISQGKLPSGFELTKEQKTGQAPLPKEYAAMKQQLLANAANVAKNEGVVSDTGTRVAMLGAGPQGVAAIDTATAKAVADQKAVQESKASDATLRSIYSPAQMDDLDKTIAKANKTGGAVFPKGDGTFGIKEQLSKNPQDALDKAADEELKRRQTAKRRV